MKRLLLFISAFLLMYGGLQAQPISGTKAVGPTGDYPTITAAIAAITTNTLSGPTILELQPAYTSGGETFPLSLSGLPTSVSNTLTIRPAATAAALAISSGATATLSLDGTRYVTIDGRPGGMGTTKALIIDNTLPTGNAIVFENDASNNTILFCTITGVTTSPTSGVVLFGSTTGTMGNDDNLISDCDILDGASTPTISIYCSGSATTGLENSGNTIANCNIGNFFSPTDASCGVNLATGANGWTLFNNRFYQSATRTFTGAGARRAINVVTGSGHNIINNTIGFGDAVGGGVYIMNGAVASTFAAINVTVGATPVTTLSGNVITAIDMVSTSTAATAGGVFCGINVTAGNVIIVNNTIGATSGVDVINLQPGAAGALMGINSSSTGTIIIANNTLGGLTVKGATAGTACALHSINISGVATSITITGNTVGNATANNMRAGELGVTTANTLVTGLNAVSIPVAGVYAGNTIQNLLAAGAATGSYVRGIQTGTTASTTSTFTVDGNTIRFLSTPSTLAGIGSGQCAALGIQFLTGTNSTVSNNTIHDIHLLGTPTTNVIAAGITHGSATNTVIANNVIYNITNAGVGTSATAPPMVAGIVMRSGTTSLNIYNNMISLGSGQTTNTTFIGIWGNHGSTPNPVDNVFHNTVNITGNAASGSNPSFAFLRGDMTTSAKTVTVNLKNNIFVNDRTGGTGNHFAIANVYGATVSATGWPANASDYNVLNANSATVGYWGAAMDMATWRTSSSGDANSYTGTPITFVNPASDLHLNMGATATSIESNGTPIAAVTTDIDGQVRPGPAGSVNGGGFLPDLGADEIDAVHLDLTAPSITYSILSSTTSTANRTLANVTIEDLGSGVPTVGATMPRIWYRRILPTSTTWASTAGTLVSGTTNNGVWSFLIDYSQLAITAAAGERWEYYVVAQDASGNIAYNPAAGASHTDVNTQVTAPATPPAYNITTGLPTTIDVGTGAPLYTSLTGATGLFNAINNDVLTANTVVNIVSDLLEDGTTPLTNIGLNGYTLTIIPAGATTRVISNAANLSTPMIRLVGAQGVTINGQSGGTGQFLRFVNTHTTAGSAQPAIHLSQEASNITISNSIVETNGSTAASGSIVIASGVNTSNTIANCDIRDAQGTPGTAGRPSNGIYINGASNTFTIQNNNIHNNTLAGVNVVAAGSGCVISGNNIYYDHATVPTTAQSGILFSGGDGQTISGNFIGGSAAGATGAAWTNNGANLFTGISAVVGLNTTTNITNNTIRNISKTATGAGAFTGIINTLGKVTIQGNTIGDPLTPNSIVNAGTGVTNGIEPNNTESSVITLVTGNTVANMSATSTTSTANKIRGIAYLTAAANPLVASAHITNNTVFNLTSHGAAVGFGIDALTAVGIMVFPNPSYPASPALVTGNTVYNITAANTGTAVTTAAGIGATNFEGEIARNTIYNIKNYSTAPTTGRAVATGIFARFFSNGFVHNNMIALGDDVADNVLITGVIIAGAGTATNFHNYFHNSIYLYNTTNAPSSSAAFHRGEPNSSATVFPVTLTNNIFYNAISSPGTHIAVKNNTTVPATGWGANASDNNLLYAVDPAEIGQWGATLYDLANWQGAPAQQDALSNSKTVSFVNPAIADLHLSGTSVGDIDLAGVQLSAFPMDYDLEPRNLQTGGAPYMGADENILSPLPLGLLTFNAKASGNNSILTWKAENEEGIVRYDIEASSDGYSFIKVGEATAQGQTMVNEYTFTHIDANTLAAANGLVFYRLKVVELDNSFTYSRTLQVAFGKEASTSLNIFPNPVTNVFTISVNNAQGTYHYQITDVSGKVITRKSGSLNGSSSWTADDLSNASSGTYFMNFSVGNTTYRIKIMKQ